MFWFTVFSALIIVVSFLLILIVLVQNSKGGGLASGFASSNQYMGVRKTADFLEKATWTLAGSLLVLSILASITIPHEGAAQKSMIEEKVKNTPDPTALPSFPNSGPAQKANKPAPAPAPAAPKK